MFSLKDHLNYKIKGYIKFVYQKALIPKFNTSLLSTNNLCEITTRAHNLKVHIVLRSFFSTWVKRFIIHKYKEDSVFVHLRLKTSPHNTKYQLH